MLVKVISSCSIKAFRYRVHALEQDLWKEIDPVSRANLALQLADAATTLARLETKEVQRLQQHGLGRTASRDVLPDRLHEEQEASREVLAEHRCENQENC